MTIVRPRFLIDENISPKLVECAHRRGYEAAHLRDLGLLTAPDWDLIKLILEADWTFVTNNVIEFRRRYRRKAVLHAGVISMEDVDAGRDIQTAAFEAALDDLDRDADLVNQEILIWPESRGVFIIRRFDLP